jgi:signal transduction histidine kinase
VWSYPFGATAVLQLAFASPRACLPGERALLAAAAVHCREALERARLESEVRRLEAESRRAEAEERRRIGRELHDEAGQALMALRLDLEMMERSAPAEWRARLAEARELAGRTAIELRRIVAALSPSVLERLGLEAAVRQLASRFARRHPARIRIRTRMNGARPSAAVQEVIYRVAQESLHNVARHSGASIVNLAVHAADKKIKLSVRDNGAGFRADQAGGKPGSFGLAGMRERAALLGGRLSVCSRPGKGTRITLELPLAPAPVVTHGKDSRFTH